jgi:hypothetical protein
VDRLKLLNLVVKVRRAADNLHMLLLLFRIWLLPRPAAPGRSSMECACAALLLLLQLLIHGAL